MTIIYNGDDPNTVLPNAPSVDQFTTLNYKQVYGSLDGSGVTLHTEHAMLPEGFRDLPVWQDWIDSVEKVLGNQVSSYIQSLLGMREPYFASTDPSIDRVTLLKIMDLIGFKYAQNDIFSDDDLRRFVRHTPLFWMEKGNRNFIQYMSYVINAQLEMQYLWTEDYVNFYPEGSPQIGKPIWAPSQNLVANQISFATGGTSTLTFTLKDGQYGRAIDSLVGGTTIPPFTVYYDSTWAGIQKMYPVPRINELLNSTTVGSTGWTLNTVTATTGQTAPDGTTAAAILTPASSSSNVVSNVVSIADPFMNHTFSIYVKGGTFNSAQEFTLKVLDSDTSTILGSVGFKLVNTTGGATQVVGVNAASGSTWVVHQLPVTNWYRVDLTCFVGGSTHVQGYIYPDVSSSNFPATVCYAMFEVEQFGALSGSSKFIPTFSSIVSVTDYSLSGIQVTVPSALPTGDTLLWSGVYNQQGTWYQTSHVYIVYDVNKFASSVNTGFSSQQAMEQFFYSVADIELVVRGFVLNLTLPPTNLYLAGDVQVSVFQPPNVDASWLYPNPLYPLQLTK